jgi:hypothetical protein
MREKPGSGSGPGAGEPKEFPRPFERLIEIEDLDRGAHPKALAGVLRTSVLVGCIPRDRRKVSSAGTAAGNQVLDTTLQGRAQEQ